MVKCYHFNYKFFESCVQTGAGSCFQIIGFTQGVRSPSTFSGQEYLSILACDFSLGSLSLSKLKTIFARPSSTGLSVLLLRSCPDAMSCKRLFMPSLICSAGELTP